MGCQHAAVGRVGAWTLPAKTAFAITNWQRRRLSSSPLSDTIFCQLDRCVVPRKMSLLLTLFKFKMLEILPSRLPEIGAAMFPAAGDSPRLRRSRCPARRSRWCDCRRRLLGVRRPLERASPRCGASHEGGEGYVGMVTVVPAAHGLNSQLIIRTHADAREKPSSAYGCKTALRRKSSLSTSVSSACSQTSSQLSSITPI